MTDQLHSWEKAPVVGLMLAQGVYVFGWYVGARQPPELAGLQDWLAVLGGVAAVAAIDGAMVATVAGMRAGRRSAWSLAAIGLTAAFGALVALDLYGALAGIGPWLHAGFAATIAAYLAHLAQPLRGAAADAADAAGAATQITQAVQVNVAGAALPATVAAYIAARAAELPGRSPAQLAAELRTSADTVRRALSDAPQSLLLTTTEGGD